MGVIQVLITPQSHPFWFLVESNETDAFIGISAPENLGTRERRVVPRPEPFEFDRVSPGAPVKKGPERVKTLGMPARRGSPVRAPRRRT